MKKIIFAFILLVLLNTVAYAQEKPEVASAAAVLMDARTGVVIYDKNMNQKNYPASTTKIMTSILALEKSKEDLSTRIPFSHTAVFSIPLGSSHIAMDEDETLSLEEALYGLLLASANEVANALGEYVSGTADEFAKRMTQRAKELGAKNTNFVNAHGFHDDNHYTTAYDMALFMKKAISFPAFVNAIRTQTYDIPPTEKQPELRKLNNSDKMIIPTNQFYNENVVGGKTGFTDEAMHTLVTYGKKGDIELIAVALHGDKNVPFTDTTALLEYGFTVFDDVKIFDKDTYSVKIPVVQKNEGTSDEIAKIELEADRDVSLFLPGNVTIDKIEKVSDLPKELTAPVKKGDKVGTLKLKYQDVILGELDLYAKESIEPVAATVLEDEQKKEEGLLKFIKITMFIVLLILFFIVILMVIMARRNYLEKKRRDRFRRRYYTRNY